MPQCPLVLPPWADRPVNQIFAEHRCPPSIGIQSKQRLPRNLSTGKRTNLHESVNTPIDARKRAIAAQMVKSKNLRMQAVSAHNFGPKSPDAPEPRCRAERPRSPVSEEARIPPDCTPSDSIPCHVRFVKRWFMLPMRYSRVSD